LGIGERTDDGKRNKLKNSNNIDVMVKVKNYLSLIKFSHTIFAMPFAMIGFVLALRSYSIWGTRQENLNLAIGWATEAPALSGKDLLIKFLLVLICMITARSAAMAFNRYLDRNFDAKNPRTSIREIPAGIISANNALLFTIACCIIFVTATYFINAICFYLSPVALLIVLGYSYTKRFTPLCHLILGLGLSLAPIGSYLAVTGKFALLPVLFSFAVIFWVSGFDIIYSLQDETFDKSEKLFSMPAWLGKAKALHVSEFFHLGSAAAVIIAGIVGHFGWLYWAGVGVFAGMLIYQHRVVKPNDLRRVNLAFMTANGIASVIFAVFVIADIFLIHSKNYHS
jgi:4-hydroxybenzoate polyprenyltransferase